MIGAVVSERERPLGDGRIEELSSEIQQLRREKVLLDVSRWVRLQNALLKWSLEDLEWHDRVVRERPSWAVDLIDAERMERERWGIQRRSEVVPPE